MKAIYETDVQNDFSLRSGALFVHGFERKSRKPYGAEARLGNIRRIHGCAKKNGLIVLGSVDRHFYEDAELVRNQGGAFVDHCMNGTPGQLRVDGLDREIDVYVQNKEGPSLSVRILNSREISDRLDACIRHGCNLIFEKQSYDVGTNPNFEPVILKLIEKGLESVAVDGFATDYCVRAAALRYAKIAKKAGRKIGRDFHIYVVMDAIKEVNIDFSGKKDMRFGKKALDEMFAAGAEPDITAGILSDGK